ncbi:MAG: carbohydrate kinase [Planctomycetes bacterium]|nr:carbohydrate kinase [Planctomycetota bacterium]
MNPIVGIGEVLWDVYPDGHKVAGGAPFNFAFHCHQLGHDAVIVSRVGDDELGRELRARVRELGLSDEYIQTDYEHPTGTVQVTLDANAVPTYTITENVAWDHIAWDEKLSALSRGARAVCFGSLAQRSSKTRDTIRRVAPGPMTFAGPKAPLYLFDVNLRPPHYDRTIIEDSLRRCDWAKLNHDELFELVDLIPLAHFDEEYPAAELRATYNFGLVCVTRGPEGAFLTTAEELFHEPGVPAQVVDTVGAGDAFTAAMVCLHLEGKSLRECARFAVHYAARVCEQPGGTPRVARAEVERAAFGT